MAFPENDVFQQQERTSPKLFTEYSLGALLAIVGLIGSFMVTVSEAAVVVILSWALIMMTPDPILVLTTICSLVVVPLGVYQLYQAYQLHKKSIHNFKRMQMIAVFIVALAIAQAAAYASIILVIGLIMLYALSGSIVFNLMVVYFLNQSEVRTEFE